MKTFKDYIEDFIYDENFNYHQILDKINAFPYVSENIPEKNEVINTLEDIKDDIEDNLLFDEVTYSFEVTNLFYQNTRKIEILEEVITKFCNGNREFFDN